MADDEFRELQVRVSELETQRDAQKDRIDQLEKLLQQLSQQLDVHGQNLEKQGGAIAQAMKSLKPDAFA